MDGSRKKHPIIEHELEHIGCVPIFDATYLVPLTRSFLSPVRSSDVK
jgi:hypothetical protein